MKKKVLPGKLQESSDGNAQRRRREKLVRGEGKGDHSADLGEIRGEGKKLQKKSKLAKKTSGTDATTGHLKKSSQERLRLTVSRKGLDGRQEKSGM